MKQTFPLPIGTVHIVGIGGIGMSGYAEVLHRRGYAVQGSDQSGNANTSRLREMGVRVMTGHAAGNVLDAAGRSCAVVVRSTAVKDENPEIVAARELHVPVIPRVELLAELMRGSWCVNVSGTHGKTTTTSMIGHVLEQAGLDPTVINGGIVNAYGSNTRLGAGRWMVVEADESDGTFAHLPSVISVITNIDPEHLDHYGDFGALKDAFVDYARNLPFYGRVVACIDNPAVAELMPRFLRHTGTYGFSAGADVRGMNLRPAPGGLIFDVSFAPELENYPRVLKDVKLPMFGPHNALNALAAFAAAHDIGVSAEKTALALAGFAGVKRRFTTTGAVNGITVIDDYAHHPAEIAAVLRAARDAVSGGGGGRVIAVVQPHRYSRLKALFDGFCGCFSQADAVIVADVYAAGEAPEAGFDKAALAAGLRAAGARDVRELSGPQDLGRLVCDIARPGDFVICMGAGSITQWAHDLPRALEDFHGAGQKKANGKT